MWLLLRDQPPATPPDALTKWFETHFLSLLQSSRFVRVQRAREHRERWWERCGEMGAGITDRNRKRDSRTPPLSPCSGAGSDSPIKGELQG